MSTLIQDKEIRGINLKWLISLVVVVATGTAQYYAIKDEMRSAAIINQYKFEILDAKVQHLDLENDQRKIEGKDNTYQINENRIMIEDYHKKKK